MRSIPNASSAKIYFYISLGWSFLFLLVQLITLYSKNGSQLVSLRGQALSLTQALSAPPAALSALQFVGGVIGIHLAFAWINATSFSQLVAHRLPLMRTRVIALLAQLIVVTVTLALANAWFYPRSTSGRSLELLLTVPSGRLILIVLAFASALYLSIGLVLRLWQSRQLFWLAITSLALLLAINLSPNLAQPARALAPPREQPDVIIVGIDSLRPDHLSRNGAPFTLMPTLEKLLSESLVFTDTLSPQPHTFPSTVSILTGQWPNRHGARANLFPEHNVDSFSSIAHDFAAAGYTTVFGMDETRFANINSSYGFETILGPEAGFLDFAMSAVSDNIILNLVANSAFGEKVFPLIYGNRALDHVYKPSSFSHQIRRAIRRLPEDRPSFIYLHFCAGHWPYRRWSLFHHEPHSDLLQGSYRDTNPNYLRALEDVDLQLHDLLLHLERAGRLENALVIVLSDHGEDFDMKKDQLNDEDGDPVTAFVTGHGGSAYRDAQVEVLLAIKRFGGQRFNSGDTPFPASLVDVAPTVADLIGHKVEPNRFDGLSLAGLLIDGQRSTDTHGGDRARFVESSYLPVSMSKAVINAEEVLAEEGGRYEVTKQGHIRLKNDYISLHLNSRQRAVYARPWILGIPEKTGTDLKIINSDRRDWWPLSSAPADAPWAELLKEACDHWRQDKIPALDQHCVAGKH